MSTLLCLGVSYRTAPVALREQLARDEPHLADLLSRTRDDARLGGALVLSTCNRVEWYGVADDLEKGCQALEQLFERASGLHEHLYHYKGASAVRHLYRVATGLDSAVLGERQILDQVKQALRRSEEHGAASPALRSIVRGALRTAERARRAAWNGAAPVSLSSMAVDFAAVALGTLQGRHVVVVGAGSVAKLVVHALRAQSVSRLTIVNRDYGRALMLAAPRNGVAAELSELPSLLHDADAVFLTTSAQEPILDIINTAPTTLTRERPLVIADLGVPRNAHVAVRNLPRVIFTDVDVIRPYVDRSLAERARGIPIAETVIAAAIANDVAAQTPVPVP